MAMPAPVFCTATSGACGVVFAAMSSPALPLAPLLLLLVLLLANRDVSKALLVFTYALDFAAGLDSDCTSATGLSNSICAPVDCRISSCDARRCRFIWSFAAAIA